MTATLEIFPGITNISSRFPAILLDAWGVFWNGNETGLFPDSKETMDKLVSNGKIIGILSNSTQVAHKEIAKLLRHGLVQGTHFHFLITSGEVARQIFLSGKLPFETPQKKFMTFGEVHPRFLPHEAIFQDTIYTETSNIDEADFIYISIPTFNGLDQENPEIFEEEIRKIKAKNLPMICANPDQFAHEGNPPKAVVRQGSIAKMYEKMGGKVFYIGKPHDDAYNITMEYFARYNITNASDILMVGDTPETDIRGARRFGMPSALVTETGIMHDRILRDGLEEAKKALSADDSPDYYIGRFIDDFHTAS